MLALMYSKAFLASAEVVEPHDELAFDAPGGLEHQREADTLGLALKILRPSAVCAHSGEYLKSRAASSTLRVRILLRALSAACTECPGQSKRVAQGGAERHRVLPEGQGAVDLVLLDVVLDLGQGLRRVERRNLEEGVGVARGPRAFGGKQGQLGPQGLEALEDEALFGGWRADEQQGFPLQFPRSFDGGRVGLGVGHGGMIIPCRRRAISGWLSNPLSDWPGCRCCRPPDFRCWRSRAVVREECAVPAAGACPLAGICSRR